MTTEYQKTIKPPAKDRIRNILSGLVHITLFILFSYSMTAYGFARASADFTAGVQLGCILLGLICALVALMLRRAIMRGYNILSAVAIFFACTIKRIAKQAADPTPEVAVAADGEASARETAETADAPDVETPDEKADNEN